MTQGPRWGMLAGMPPRKWLPALPCLVLLAAPALSQPSGDAGGKFPAVLNPGAIASIKAQQDERVAEVLVDLGSRVEAGQLMLRFVDAEEQVLVRRAEVRLRQSITEYERIERLHDQGQVSDELLEQALTAVRLAEADLDLARIRLDDLAIRAPFGGVVAERYVDPGTSVERGDPLLQVIAPSSLRLEVMLPEAALPRLRGQRSLTIEVVTPPSTFQVPLPQSSFVVDAASRTFLLQVEIDNEDGRIVPGSSCLVSIGDGAP